MARQFLLGVFDDDHTILNATKEIRAAGHKIDDVLSPFAIHGIEDAMGLKDTRLHTAGFIFGTAGCLIMLLFIIWINTVNYPINYGGKPHLALPAFIPITFEFTVLSASVGMVLAFFIRSGLTAIRPKEPLDPRITNDKFVMAFDKKKMTGQQETELRRLLDQHGAIEVNEKEVNW